MPLSPIDGSKVIKLESRKISLTRHPCQEPQTTIFYWLFQLDDSKSLLGKWLFHQTSIIKWLFGVPGASSCLSLFRLSLRSEKISQLWYFLVFPGFLAVCILHTWIFQVCKIYAFSSKKPTKRQKFYISRRSRYMYT